MIIALTPNVALDITYYLDHLEVGEANRVQSIRVLPGGKGINVLRVLDKFGKQQLGSVPKLVATGFCGGANGERVAQLLQELAPQIEQAWTPLTEESRQTIAVVDPKYGATVFNEQGPTVSDADWRALAAQLLERVCAKDVVAICGSTPPGTDPSVIPALVEALTQLGARVLVDAAGPNLLAAAQAGAWLLKPNHLELAATVGHHDLCAGAQELLARGARCVVVSAGSEGLWAFCVANTGAVQAWRARPVKQLSGNPTGAGDAAVAALCLALEKAADSNDLTTQLPQILPTAVALSGAAVLAPVAGDFDLAGYQAMQPLIEVEEVDVSS